MERNEGIIRRARVKSVAKAIPAAATGPPRLIFSQLRGSADTRAGSLSLSIYRCLDPPARWISSTCRQSRVIDRKSLLRERDESRGNVLVLVPIARSEFVRVRSLTELSLAFRRRRADASSDPARCCPR